MRASSFAVLSLFCLVAACGDGKPAEAPKSDVTPAPIDAGPSSGDAGASGPSDAAVAFTPPPREDRCIAGKWIAGKGCTAEKPYEPNGQVDKPAEAMFNAIAADMTKSFAQENKKECPGKTLHELFGETKPGHSTSGKWKDLADKGQAYADKLEGVPKTHHSGLWAAVAFARIGIMWSHVRSQLDACTDKNVALFTPEQQKLIASLEKSGRQEMLDQASEIKKAVADFFAKKKTAEEGATEELAIRRLALAIATANAYGATHPLIDAAKAELTQLKTAVGEERLKAYLSGAPDPFDPDRKRMLADVPASQ